MQQAGIQHVEQPGIFEREAAGEPAILGVVDDEMGLKADEIGIGRVVFPRDPGTLSAWGMLYSDVVHAMTRAHLMKADEAAASVLGKICAELHGKGAERLRLDGITPQEQILPITLDMRYPGQAYEIQVQLDVPPARPGAVDLRYGDALAAAVQRFHDLHLTQYAHAERHVTPEIVAVRIAATGKLKKPAERAFLFQASTEPKGQRRVFAGGSWHEATVLERSRIASDVRVAGPLIVEEAHATHFIPPEWELAAAPTGDLVATKRSGGAS